MLNFKSKAILDLKIGRKLGLMLGVLILQLAMLVGLASWALQLVSARMEQAQQQSERMVLSWRVAADLSEINSQIGNMILSADLQIDQAQAVVMERDVAAALKAMKAAPDSEKGTKLVGMLETALQSWKRGNQDIVAIAGQGKRAAAAEAWMESTDRYGDAKAAIGDLLEYRNEQLEQMTAERLAFLKKVSVMLLAIGAVAIVIAVYWGRKLTQNIARPLEESMRLLGGIADGDISRDVPDEFTQRGDEVGGLSRAMQRMTTNLRAMVAEITGGISILSSSAGELTHTASQMTTATRNASGKAHHVAEVSDSMSAQITSVAVGMQQTSANLLNVSSATEQMAATIGEIASNSEQAQLITREARQQADRITDQISQLGAATRQIGKITETISGISSQTNLLALNATIEAARAGAAGKGFAVVANEIKELAQQTAMATSDIKDRIDGVQSATAEGIAEIEKISQVVEKVISIVNAIAVSIDAQAGVTRSIAQNISEASAGVSDANLRISESSTLSREMSRDVGSVDAEVGEMATNGEQVRNSAGELSRVAEQLREAIGRFRV